MSEMAELIFNIRFVIFRLVLSFLHLVYSGLEYFDIAWALFKRKLFSMFPHRDSQSYISDFVTDLRKCPNHVAVITDDKMYLEDFSNLVIWCVAADISFISFYDYTGYLKDNEEAYFSYLMNTKKLDSNSVIFNQKNNSFRNGLYRNGFSNKIHVNVLSPDDGKEAFTKLVENICERALSHELKSGDIDEKYLDEEIYKVLGFKEPDLAIICGNVCSTFGFLPWHIRLTEFLRVPSLKNITVSDFTFMLWRYSKCHQRFGS